MPRDPVCDAIRPLVAAPDGAETRVNLPWRRAEHHIADGVDGLRRPARHIAMDRSYVGGIERGWRWSRVSFL